MKLKKYLPFLLVVTFLAFSFWSGNVSAQNLTGNGVYIPTNTGMPNPPGGVKQILENFLNWLLIILGLIALISFIVAGIIYLVSAGEEDTIEKAKRAMTWSIVGVIVALAGYVIVVAINTALGGTSYTF